MEKRLDVIVTYCGGKWSRDDGSSNIISLLPHLYD
jgi:hypothetical protein